MKVGFSGFHCISETLTIVRVHLKKQLNSFALKKKGNIQFLYNLPNNNKVCFNFQNF